MSTATHDIIPPEDPQTRRHDEHTPSAWLRKNLFSTPGNSITTIVTAVILAFLTYQFVRWAVTRDYEIVRFALRIFMIGSFPDDQLWRLWIAGILLAFNIGLVGGSLARNAYNIAVESEIEAKPDNLLSLLRRFWVLIAVLYFFSAFARTIMPAVLVTAVVIAAVLGRLAGWLAPKFIRHNIIYIGALVTVCSIMVVSGTSAFGGFCLGFVVLLWVSAALTDRLERSASAHALAASSGDGQQSAIQPSVSTAAIVTVAVGLAPLWYFAARIVANAFQDSISLFGPREAKMVMWGTVAVWLLIAYFVGRNASGSLGAGGSRAVRVIASLLIDLVNLAILLWFADKVAGFLRDSISLFGPREEWMVIGAVALAYVAVWIIQTLGSGTYGQRIFGVLGANDRAEITMISPYAGLAVGAVIFVLVRGIGFEGYGWEDWGGLMVNVFTAVLGVSLGMPLGILLALGRRSELPVIKSTSVLFIEFIRGVPLISLLMFSITLLPLFLPPDWDTPAPLTLSIVVIMFFSAAYIAEIVRGGLQAVAKGQTEAGQALGLKPGIIQRMIVLPQALRAVIPAMVGQFIALFKDTSLLSVVGILEFLGASTVANTQNEFLGKGLAPVTLLFVAIGFWAFAYTMSKESRRLETRLGVGTR